MKHIKDFTSNLKNYPAGFSLETDIISMKMQRTKISPISFFEEVKL